MSGQLHTPVTLPLGKKYHGLINPLAPELFFFILAHPVYKM